MSRHLTRAYNSAISFFTHHKTYTAVLFLTVSAVLFFTLFSKPKQDGESYVVASGPISQYVKISGKVESSKDASLSFQTTGSVSYVGIKEGDKVSQGKVLATLEAGDAQASLLQAEASLANAEAILGQLKQGARPEEIAVKEQVLANAKANLDQAYQALPDTIKNVDATTADVIKNKFSSLFVFSNSRYLLSFSSCDQRLQSEIEVKRSELENILADFQKKSGVVSAISSQEVLDTSFQSAYQAVILTNDLVNAISNLLLSSCSISNSSLDTYRSTLSGVKASMTSLFSDISLKRQSLSSAKNAVSQATRDLDLTKIGTDPYKVKAQLAVVSQAEAQVALARRGVEKTLIKAPFSGVVSSVDLSVGETIAGGKPVISLFALDSFEIKAKIPEIDIVKVKEGATVEVTLDAYGSSEIFPATVTRINPAAATEGNVPVYTAVVTFNGKDSRIREGMTANVKITTESKKETVTIPSRFVAYESPTQGKVWMLVDGKPTSRNVTFGIRGTDGMVEIKEGLLIGDTIVEAPRAKPSE